MASIIKHLTHSALLIKLKRRPGLAALLFFLFLHTASYAQIQNYDETKRGSIYFNVGYQFQFFGKGKIHIKQDALKNDYNLQSVTAVPTYLFLHLPLTTG